MLNPPEIINATTDLPGTEGFPDDVDADNTLHSDSQDELTFTWDEPEDPDTEGICQLSYLSFNKL